MARQLTKAAIALIASFLVIFCLSSVFVLDPRPLRPYNPFTSNPAGFEPGAVISLGDAPTVRIESNRVAYATFYSTRVQNDSSPDPYFTATRVLAYQLLHHPVTKTSRNVPFLVIVPPHVSEYKRSVLAAEGATIIPVDYLNPKDGPGKPGESRWVDQYTKLRLFQLDQFDRILFLDNDMLVIKPLDPIFSLPMVTEVRNTNANVSVRDDEAHLPPQYLIIGVSDTGGAKHPFPPEDKPDSRINGGFFLLRPDQTLFNYYKSVIDHKDRFNSGFMEQGLLNYAHRHDGAMPALKFPPGQWNVNWPSLKDLEGGAATLHDKFWVEKNKSWIDRKLIEMWWRVQGQMEGFWQRESQGRRGQTA